MKSTILLLVIVFFTEIISANSKPNFVWIISEDNSIHYLDHFFPDGADTPNIKNSCNYSRSGSEQSHNISKSRGGTALDGAR